MFLGQTVNLIDEKNRLVLPTRYREELGYIFYMVLDFDKCLSFYPSEIYKKKAEKINSLDDFSSAARSVKRVFFANSFDLSMDKQGRIQLPKIMTDKVGIKKEVVVVGMSDHLEIWDSEVYRNNEVNEEDNYSTLASELIGGNYGK